MKTFIPIIVTIFLIFSCNNGQDNKVKSKDSVKNTSTKEDPFMSAISIIAIKGNQLDKTSKIFDAFNYADLHKDRQFTSLDTCIEFLDENYFDYAQRNIAIRGIYHDNGWTIILDPEMVDMTSDTAIETLSRNLKAAIFTFVAQRTSSTFGFAKYNPTRQRYFYVTDGQIAESIGNPLTEEQGLNINQNIFTDDIFELANKLGIDVEAKHIDSTFVVKELEYKE